MPPVGGKGKGKGSRDHRRSLSRNTTPSSIGASVVQVSTETPTLTAYLDMPLTDIGISSEVTYDEIVERVGNSSGIPDSKNLENLAADLQILSKNAATRTIAYNKGMRELAVRRKHKIEDDTEKERQDREQEQKNEKQRREALDEEEDDEVRGRKINKMKKKKDVSKVREERPLTHGAHGVARQDVAQQDEKAMAKKKRSGTSPKNKVKREQRPSISQSPASQAKSPPIAPATLNTASIPGSPDSSDSSLSSRQPAPAATIPHFQAFGPDPSTFPDPTIYHIREVEPSISEEEIKEIYSVASYPKHDLSDLIPGTPPDKDFSNAKPSNQVSFNTFQSYIEPYFRPLNEEDLSFLREKGDRSAAFVIPRRGKKNYKEIWAEEDGAMSLDSPVPGGYGGNQLPANQPRGSIEHLNDEVAETDKVSAGPVLERLLAATRPEQRPPPTEDKIMVNGVGNGESSNNGINGDINMDGDITGGEDKPIPFPPAAFIPDSAQPGWKVSTTKLDYAQMEERLKGELRVVGFLGEGQEPDYDAHYDDETGERLRVLQEQLRKTSILNGARKNRIMDLVKDRMAYQEYQTIAEDLDSQVQQSYVKRTRTMGKSKKHKRPGGAGGGSHYVNPSASVAKAAIGDMTKTLMERRAKWAGFIGPVLEDVETTIPKQSIFKKEDMGQHIKMEETAWDEEAEE